MVLCSLVGGAAMVPQGGGGAAVMPWGVGQWSCCGALGWLSGWVVALAHGG